MGYVDEVLAKIKEKNASEPEFIQAAQEVLESLRCLPRSPPEWRSSVRNTGARATAGCWERYSASASGNHCWYHWHFSSAVTFSPAS